MRCPSCEYGEDKVIDTRPADDGSTIRRRRECLACGCRFTTFEKIEEHPLIVVKKDGNREVFDRSKILRGIIRACEKRPISSATIEEIVQRIEIKSRNLLHREITVAEIGELVMQELKAIDEIAYIRFASVYRQFADLNSFMGILEDLVSKKQLNNSVDFLQDKDETKQKEN